MGEKHLDLSARIFNDNNSSVAMYCEHITDKGGFHLVDLIIKELKDHMICYKLECSH